VPCSLTQVYTFFGENYCIHLQDRKSKRSKQPKQMVCFFLLVTYLVCCQTLKMEAARFSETSMNLWCIALLMRPDVRTSHRTFTPSWNGFVSCRVRISARAQDYFASFRFPQSLQADAVVIAYIIPRPASCSSFPINYSP
jgi:hypothetical protein